ncbi:MAG TPA: alpha/beta hydrolase [Steroidobacteraceae bacterium]|nr:alpha/beta hydrolase [Steroidobacteraceae bacterium]
MERGLMPTDLCSRARRRARALTALLLSLLPTGAWALGSLTPGYLDEFDAQKTSVSLGNGVALAYIDMGPRSAPPVVLIHGYTDSARDWAPIAPLLTRFRLIIVDLRGHGASSKPDCCYTRFDFADDIKLLLDRLHIERADIIGHSLGSIAAQTFAELWPQSTRRLVLISSTGTSFGIPDAGMQSAHLRLPSWLASVEELKDPIDPDGAFMRNWWQVSLSVNPQFFSSRQRRDAAAIPARIWRAIADQCLIGVDLRWMLPRIQARTLLIWGARDALMSASGRDALRTGIARAEVRIFPALGHDLFWQDPRAVATVLIDFLANR